MAEKVALTGQRCQKQDAHAKIAIGLDDFAVAAHVAASHKDRAFQASSPKNFYGRSFGPAFFCLCDSHGMCRLPISRCCAMAIRTSQQED